MMKNLPICLLLFITVCANAQPQLVGTFARSGVTEGGTIFRLNLPATTPGIIHNFNNLAPHRPRGGVVAGNGNLLYGLLDYNGTDNNGAFYSINKDGTGFTKIYDVPGSYYLSNIPFSHSDGRIYFSIGTEVLKYNPATSLFETLPLLRANINRQLTIDANNWIYFVEGNQNPVIYKMKTDGTSETDLHALTGATDGWNALAGITVIPGDSLFGVMINGGTNDEGTIYSLKTDGSGFGVRHHFTLATGRYPESKLVYFDGKLYGTTSQGGDFGNGVLYCINSDGTNYRVLHHFIQIGTNDTRGNISISSNGRVFGTYGQFSSIGGIWRAWKVDTSGENFEDFINLNQYDGGHFNKDILLLDDETIFLTTGELGRHDGGAINQFDTLGNGGGLFHFGASPNGFRPNPLIKSTNGKLYGTATIGGPGGNGLIYTINTDGSGYQVLHQFTDAEGYEPTGKLLESSDGKLYGSTSWGGPNNAGNVFKMDKTGANFQVIYSFPLANEAYTPWGGLVEDAIGTLYGTTRNSTTGSGTVYRISKTGTGFTIINTFSDILTPFDGLMLDNGWLYGSCTFGGAENKGGIFRVRTNGTGYQVLHDFTGANSGAQPRGIPYLASNGKLYGVTIVGGSTGEGTLYSMDLTGTNFTTLREFVSGTDGGFPISSMIQGSNGFLYGANAFGGVDQGGTVYRANLDGSGFTVVKSFNYATEGQSLNGILDLNGNFVLPVELISFTAEKKGTGVLLNWKTAQEQNSDHFEIERSTGGNNFITIGKVKAAGNTTALTSYSFTDQHTFNGINLYRLKQVDMDEKFDYSKTIPVDCSVAGSIVISPNPVTDKLFLRLPANNHFTSLRILDVSGKPVFQKAILSSSSSQQFDVSHLPKGWYVLQLQGDKEEKQVFVKQ